MTTLPSVPAPILWRRGRRSPFGCQTTGRGHRAPRHREPFSRPLAVAAALPLAAGPTPPRASGASLSRWRLLVSLGQQPSPPPNQGALLQLLNCHGPVTGPPLGKCRGSPQPLPAPLPHLCGAGRGLRLDSLSEPGREAASGELLSPGRTGRAGLCLRSQDRLPLPTSGERQQVAAWPQRESRDLDCRDAVESRGPES